MEIVHSRSDGKRPSNWKADGQNSKSIATEASQEKQRTAAITWRTSFSSVFCMNENHEVCSGQEAACVAAESDESSLSDGTSGFL